MESRTVGAPAKKRKGHEKKDFGEVFHRIAKLLVTATAREAKCVFAATYRGGPQSNKVTIVAAVRWATSGAYRIEQE